MNKIKIEIKSWLNGSVLFEYECENNTIAKTVQEAVNRSADLRSANLSYANLSYANLRSANLSYANLSYANLRSADLRYADLSYAKNSEWAEAITTITPEGSFIGWKKCRNDLIVKLLIPEEAKRSNATSRKCRAEYVEVLEIIDLNDKRKKPTEAISEYDAKTKYVIGERVTCDKWDENRFEECSGGIHFYITRLEAEKH